MEAKKSQCIITPSQTAFLDYLIPSMTTKRFDDEDLDPIFIETVADHVLSMLKQAPPFIKDHKLDRYFSPQHSDVLIKTHDLPEIELEKDITVWEIEHTPHLKFEKKYCEMMMIQQFREQYGDWLADPCLEYMEQETDAAKFVKWLDKYNATEHIFQKQFEKPFPTPDWLVYGVDRLVKAAKTDFLIPPTLQVMEERKPLFKKHNLLDTFHAKEKELLTRG